MPTDPGMLATTVLSCLLLVVGAIYWLRALVRSSTLPQCWRCGASKVRLSTTHRAAAGLAATCFLTAYRCRGCRVKFYGLRTHRHFIQRTS